METSSRLLRTGKSRECPLSSIGTDVAMCHGAECFAYLDGIEMCAYIKSAEIGLQLTEKALCEHETTLPGNDFKSFYCKHYESVSKTAYNLLKSPEKAENITQEAFAKAYIGHDILNAASPLTAWLYKVTINLCLNELRWQKVCAIETQAEFDNEEISRKLFECCLCDSERYSCELEVKSLVDMVFNALPSHYCQVLILKYVDGLSYGDIGCVMKSTTSSVRSMVHRGRKRFVDIYEDINRRDT